MSGKVGEAGGRGVQGESSLAPAQAWGLFLLAAGPQAGIEGSLASWPKEERHPVPPAVCEPVVQKRKKQGSLLPSLKP